MSFIDRDPKQMMKYGENAKVLIGEVTLLIRKVEGLLDAYSTDLDDPTRKQIQTLHQCCTTYLTQIKVYQNIADSIYKKGKALDRIRNGE